MLEVANGSRRIAQVERYRGANGIGTGAAVGGLINNVAGIVDVIGVVSCTSAHFVSATRAVYEVVTFERADEVGR